MIQTIKGFVRVTVSPLPTPTGARSIRHRDHRATHASRSSNRKTRGLSRR